MGEKIQLTLDPADKEQGLNYAERSERLRELVAKRKAAGLSARDPNYVADLLREVEGLNKDLEPKEPKVFETEIEINDFTAQRILGEDIGLLNGELFIKVRHNIGSEDIVNIDNEGIVKFQCSDVSAKPFRWGGQTCFKVRSRNDGDVKYINSQGKQIEFDKFSRSQIIDPLADENGDLRYFVVDHVDDEDGFSFSTINDLNNEELTAFIEQFQYQVEPGYITYQGEYNRDNICGYISHDGERAFMEGMVSLPFKYNGKFCFIEAKEKYRKKSKAKVAKLSLVNDAGKEIGTPWLGLERSNVINIKKVVAGNDVGYFTATIHMPDSLEQGEKLFKFDGQTIKEVTGPENCVMNGFTMVNNRLMVHYLSIDTDKEYIHIDGLPEPFEVFKAGLDLDQSEENILKTSKPVNVLGKTGEVFFFGSHKDEGDYQFWIENQSVVLPFGVFSNKIVLKDHLFWGFREFIEKEPDKKKVQDKTEYVWLDGQKTKYCADKILKFIYTENKYFMIGLVGTKLVIKEIVV